MSRLGLGLLLGRPLEISAQVELNARRPRVDRAPIRGVLDLCVWHAEGAGGSQETAVRLVRRGRAASVGRSQFASMQLFVSLCAH